MTLLAGAAVVDITPPAGLAMSGFVARTQSATGTHDPLTARALAIGDTVLVVVDVVALSAVTCARIRSRLPLPDEAVVIAALHTHGGPVPTVESLGGTADPAFMARLEDGCVNAARAALADRRPARLFFGNGPDPGVARNRRHPGGRTDEAMPMLVATGEDGRPVAHLVSHACHPVVLGADNTLYTADYPGFARAAVEAAHPGTVAIFLTGCAGEANTGHTAHGSISTASNPLRTFAEAKRVGEAVAAAALAAPLAALGEAVASASATIELPLERRETEPPQILAARWRREMGSTADPARRALLAAWSAWAEGPALSEPLAQVERVSVLHWGGLSLVALPGEIFAATARAIRAGVTGPAVVGCYADSCRGYIPPLEEYPFGGYEVDEAHRYFGMPAGYAPGSAERLAAAATALARRIGGAG
ncbi:MAG: neutral/alkaline non-lysosomal ceramidase N-terminal domain-containing protein [Burkholderiales bacterium]|nr:neutral/alkaline non-lysosomal ceramidase N-terminal domain-containing protein [Burkholderiales bacterium]